MSRVAALAVALELPRATLVGESMGGYVALAFAQAHPDRLRSLVLADTRAAADSDGARAGRAQALAALRERGVDDYLDGSLPRLLAPDARPELLAMARSLAEMPVLVRPFASIDTQNAVSKRELFWVTISGMSSSSSRSGVIERQISPRPYRAMKLIASGVIFSAAIVRSPSFSRFSSSQTMTMRPARMAATASSIGANGALTLLAPLAMCIERDDGCFFFNA